jgi:predicted amidohydrolase
MAGWAERAKGEGAQLVAFPELCIPGICRDERLVLATLS